MSWARVDDANELTPMGQELARLPLDPRVGRMILEARDRQKRWTRCWSSPPP